MKDIIDLMKKRRGELKAELAKIEAGLARLEPATTGPEKKKPGRKPKAAASSAPESPFKQE